MGNHQEIREALGRILASRGFRSSARLGRFLTFVVEKSLEGRQDEIKEYVIATQVYGKTPDYDPQVDSSVRVEASRLRSRLRQYYEGEGQSETLRILLPRGRYVPVFGGPTDEPSRIETAPAPIPEPPSRWKRKAPLIAVGFAVAFAGAALLLDWPAEPTQELFQSTPITSYPGLEHAASISPDGRYVAFARSLVGETRSDIYVRQLDSDSTLQLSTHPALETSPAWSPDGTAIAFLRRINPRRSAVVLVPPLGGPERILAEVNAPPASGLTWSPDGSAVAVIERLGEGTDRHSAFKLVPVGDGGSMELGISLAELSKANYPAFSPDGTQIAWLGTKGPWLANLYVADVHSDSFRRLASLEGQGAGIAWTHTGRELIVGRFTPLKIRSLLRVRVRDGSVSEVAVGDNPSQPTISRDGSRLAFTEGSLRFDIVRYSAAEGQETTDPRFIASTRFDGNPQYSPDGSRIAFSSARSGRIEIWACQADGSNPMQLTSIGQAGSPRWSPDGSRIAFDSTAGGNADIYVVGANGSVLQQVTKSESEDVVPAWSPDGHWLYFASDRGGDSQIWRTSAHPNDPSPATAVTKQGAFYPSISSDGKHLYFSRERANPSSLWRKPLPGGDAEELIPALRSGWGNWQLAKTGIYFIDAEPDPSAADESAWTLRFLDPQSGNNTKIRDLLISSNASEPTLGGPGLSVSPDGKWILSGQTSLTSDLMLVENFR